MKKFKRAQAQNQASIAKHLSINKSVESSSDEENDATNDEHQQAFTKALSPYESEGGDSQAALSHLTDVFQFGGAVCLICISSVKKTDAIWSCSTCYTSMHLSCVQHWIRDSISYKQEKGIKPLWACPKCRTDYPENDIPKNYECYCGKIIDPPHQPWAIPHSCGETCQKSLKPYCGHNCILLCHPGPCPPCPKMIKISCHCGKQSPIPRRCNAKFWSCKTECDKKLSNCNHNCTVECHSGICPPCTKEILSQCHCLSSKKIMKCSESNWKCDKKCNKLYSCKIHSCNGICHKDNGNDCGECPIAKNRSCPCGKKYYDVSCEVSTVSTCNDTCGKILDCGTHKCNNKCHYDKCGQCLEKIIKKCKCNSFTKEIACNKDYHCNKKCPQLRQCGKHLCNKKCCDCLKTNTFNICEKICDNMLNCRKHKCPAPCHSGPCYPCPRTITIQCRCGNSKITVPCGTKKKIKPPPCNKLCKLPPICHHTKQDSHKCHTSDCPPCKKICNIVRDKCGHKCVVTCHTKVLVKVRVNGSAQPAGPWEILKEKLELQTFSCPPCEVSIMVTCIGEHETKPWPCYKAIPTSCGRTCGKLLNCTNHNCQLICHKIDNDNCQQCELPCQFERIPGCTHLCSKPCHKKVSKTINCPPCQQIVKISCHCGINSLYKRCYEITGAKGKIRDDMLKCGNQCPKINTCGHRCIDDCHSGNCKDSIYCNKRVKVSCKCQRIKKSAICSDVQKGNIKINCDDECIAVKIEKDKLREIEIAKKKKQEEIKNQIEVERFERKFKPKKKSKDKYESNEELQYDNIFIKKIILFGIIFIVTVIVSIYMTNGF